MNDEDFKERAALARHLASFADPFTKKRLLDLAERYEVMRPGPRTTPRPTASPEENSGS